MPLPDLAISTQPSRSLPATVAVYECFGFTGRLLGVGDSYAILRRGEVELHSFAHPTPRPAEPHAGCHVRVADVHSWHRAFQTSTLPRRGSRS